MEKIITYDNLRGFAYSNDKLITGEVRGIVLNFMGLGTTLMFHEDTERDIRYAEKGLIFVTPYCNPWSWMNRRAVRYVDEIVAVLCEKYALNTESVKIASVGGSMGGLAALVYCAYAAITPSLCVTNCPVCDLPYHYTERPDLPRTLYSAFGEYEGTMEEAMQTCSPIHLVDRLPRIAYTVFHCEADRSVNIDKHSRRFVSEMQREHEIVLHTVPDRGHGDLTPEMWAEYDRAILSGF